VNGIVIGVVFGCVVFDVVVVDVGFVDGSDGIVGGAYRCGCDVATDAAVVDVDVDIASMCCDYSSVYDVGVCVVVVVNII